MSLGFPIHLAPGGVGWAYTRACHVTAAVCILITMLFMGLLQLVYPERPLWPTIIALLPMLATLWLLDRKPNLFTALSYLGVGSASLYWFVLAASYAYPTATTTDTFIFTMPKIALILIGGMGAGVLPSIGWMFAAFVAGGTVTVLAAMPTGMPARLDGTTITVAALLVLVLGLIAQGQDVMRSVKPRLYLAAREEHLSSVRQSLEIQAAAMLHDTVLGDLAALGAAGDGPLAPELRQRIESDLASLMGEEWLVAVDSSAHREPLGWSESRLAGVIEDARAGGLTVEVSGERATLARLSPDAATAVALAVRQCLVNVIDHAHTDHAEVVLYGSDSDVSIMVVDAGRGFVLADAGHDRLGLRHSVRSRIETVGGAVQVWSTPGRGTTVLIRVPAPSIDGPVAPTDAEARR